MEAIRRAAELEQVAAVGESVEERRRQPLVAGEDGRPVGEGPALAPGRSGGSWRVEAGSVSYVGSRWGGIARQ